MKGSLSSADWAQKIRLLREEKGWSQKDLAEELDIHPQSISEIERNNERLTLERLNRILDALGFDSEVSIQKTESTTRSEWGSIRAEAPERRRIIRNARELAERLARELYRRYDIDGVYCIGSLAQNGGRSFERDSDIDLLVDGLDRSDLISAKSALEINVMEPPHDEQDFPFDLQRLEEFDRPVDDIIEQGNAVFIPDGNN